MTPIQEKIEQLNTNKHYVSITEIKSMEYAVSVLKDLLSNEKTVIKDAYRQGRNSVFKSQVFDTPRPANWDEQEKAREEWFNETFDQK